MVLNEWMGFAHRILHRVLRLCHRPKRYLLATYVSLLWLLDSASASIYSKTPTKCGHLPSMVYGLGRA